MKPFTYPHRVFLFLQGPPGPFFKRLAERLSRHGATCHRINLNGGDRHDWRGEGAVDFTRRASDWPMYFDRFVRRNGVTDLVLYGDCRPMHFAAHQLARLRGIRIHVFEEGYIRPDWMTLERDGVNGYSRLVRDPDEILDAARDLPPLPDLPPITASFKRRAHDSYWYYHRVLASRLRFPFYRSHRREMILGEGFGWIYKFARARHRQTRAKATLEAVQGQKYFLFPLQLTGDYQIREHSPFGTMRVAVDYVLDSFAQFAPHDAVLLVKEHPLDCGFHSWPSFIARRAQALGIADRVHHVDGGDLQELARDAAGMVCVNSTSGTLAIETGTPVIVLGDAIYDVAGITHQGPLDQFWRAPQKPDASLYDAFKRVLHARCLVRGGVASESAIQTLLDSSVPRLLADDTVDAQTALMPHFDYAAGSRPSSFR